MKLKCERCGRKCIGLFITVTRSYVEVCSYEKKESE